MILSGQEIYRKLGSSIIIEPFKPSRLNPNSYNLTIHNTIADQLYSYNLCCISCCIGLKMTQFCYGNSNFNQNK